ncbi:hypothetical protein ACFPT0_06310 [Acinetobacter portensis]|uniref:hypothetical protein n=1 Tax=Acinetobacter portensis TaxID=1839785 RepID=UPI0030C7E3F1
MIQNYSQNMKLYQISSISIAILSLTACSIISPLVVNYNGVRRDVATAINQNSLLTISSRQVLVAYAKEQQKILSSQYQSNDQQQLLAKERAIGTYCSQQKVSTKKLNWVDSKIFALPEQQEKLKYNQALQSNINLDTTQIDCTNKF